MGCHQLRGAANTMGFGDPHEEVEEEEEEEE